MDLNYKEILYKIIMKIESEQLLFKGETKDIFPTEEYSINYTLDSLKKINKFFYGFDNINQVFNEINNFYTKNKVEITENSDNLILKIPLDLSNFKEIIFELNKKPTDLKRDILELNSKKNEEVSQLKFSNEVLENKLNSIFLVLDEHKKEIDKLKKEDNSKKDKIESLNKRLKESDEIINKKSMEIEKLKKEIDNFKCSKNEEINNLKNDVNDLKKQLNEIKDILETKFFFLTDIDIEEFKKNYKNSEYFRDIMNKYYNKISILNNNTFFFQRESYYKKSYEVIIDLIFEELNENNGKDCDKILEFKGTSWLSYDNYTVGNWNAFFIKNVVHQLFYSQYNGTNEEMFDKIYEKIVEISPKLKEYSFLSHNCLEKAKNDIKEFNNTFKIINIIKLFKKIIL